MTRRALLERPLAALDDAEGESVPSDLPRVIDAHVHLFPPRVFAAIFRWFDEHGWPIRHRLNAEEVVDFLVSRGIKRLVGLSYAHKPGMARALNDFMADLCARRPEVIGLGTVLPGEPDARAVVLEAFDRGLHGLKLHCHVQCFAPDAPEVGPIYDLCAERGYPIVLHAGREPKSHALHCDPHELCTPERVENVLREHPRLRLSVPHLGLADYADYERLLERYDNLWLDTAMAVAGYFDEEGTTAFVRLAAARPERLLYGTDFPNLPYAWDRELRRLFALRLPKATLAAILGQNAERLFTPGVGAQAMLDA